MHVPLLVALLVPTLAFAADKFIPTPDHEVQPGVPQGKVIKMEPWKSQIFPNTTRDWWIYVPAQYQPEQPAAVMVIQDGHDYVNPKGNWRAPTVFDNLIARGGMPVTIGIFINPGHDPGRGELKTAWSASNRSFEYNSLSDLYARFLAEEILPEVEKSYRLTSHPEQRARESSAS